VTNQPSEAKSTVPKEVVGASESQYSGRVEDELAAHLDRGQLVVETSRPVLRAVLTARVATGLWVLRVVVLLASALVIYVFVARLH
jgi:hypothetical protein